MILCTCGMSGCIPHVFKICEKNHNNEDMAHSVVDGVLKVHLSLEAKLKTC